MGADRADWADDGVPARRIRTDLPNLLRSATRFGCLFLSCKAVMLDRVLRSWSRCRGRTLDCRSQARSFALELCLRLRARSGNSQLVLSAPALELTTLITLTWLSIP